MKRKWVSKFLIPEKEKEILKKVKKKIKVLSMKRRNPEDVKRQNFKLCKHYRNEKCLLDNKRCCPFGILCVDFEKKK